MSGQLILYACWGFIAWLFYQDMAWRKIGSKALLIPGAFIAIQGSRPVSYWFGYGGGSESNPVNTLVAVVMIGSAIYLASKHVVWGEAFRRNKLLFLLYGYLLLSCLWSEQPGNSFKRLLKDFACVLIALVFLTE